MSLRANRVLLAVAAPLLAVALLESAARLVFPKQQDADGPLTLVVGDAQLRGVSEFDPDLFYTLRRNATFDFNGATVTTNRFGTRAAAPPLARDPRSLRVVCLGDSTAFGNVTTYPRLLARLLQQAYPERTIEVLNAGIPGGSSFMGAAMFRRDLAALAPDVVTFCYGFNDTKVEGDFSTDRERAAAMHRPLARFLRFASRLRCVELLAGGFIRPAPTNPRPHDSSSHGKPWRVPAADHAENVVLLANECAAIGAKLVVISQPHGYPRDDSGAAEIVGRFDALYSAERDATARSGALFFDAAAHCAGRDPDDLFLDRFPGKDSIHENAIGLCVFAEDLFAFLVDQDALPAPVAMPALPRLDVRAPAFAAAAADLDGSGLDELYLATVVGGRPDLLRFDADTERFEPLALDLPAPSCAVSLLPRPSDPDEIVIVGVSRPGVLTWRSVTLSGKPTTVPSGEVGVPAAVTEVRGLAGDLDGDGATDSLLVDMGPAGPPVFAFIGKDLESIGWCDSISAGGPSVNFCCGRFVTGRPDVLAVAQGTRKCDAFLLSKRPFSGVTGAVDLGIHFAPAQVVAGSFTRRGAQDELAIVRGAGVMIWHGGASFSEMFLPHGALRLDSKLPGIRVVKIGKRGNDRLLFSSASDGRVRAVLLSKSGARRVLDVAFP